MSTPDVFVLLGTLTTSVVLLSAERAEHRVGRPGRTAPYRERRTGSLVASVRWAFRVTLQRFM